MLILHPAKVVSVEQGVYTAELEEDDVPLEPEQPVFIYFEISRTFMKQPARIKEIVPEDPKRSLCFTMTGNAVSVERSTAYRPSSVR